MMEAQQRIVSPASTSQIAAGSEAPDKSPHFTRKTSPATVSNIKTSNKTPSKRKPAPKKAVNQVTISNFFAPKQVPSNQSTPSHDLFFRASPEVRSKWSTASTIPAEPLDDFEHYQDSPSAKKRRLTSPSPVVKTLAENHVVASATPLSANQRRGPFFEDSESDSGECELNIPEDDPDTSVTVDDPMPAVVNASPEVSASSEEKALEATLPCAPAPPQSESKNRSEEAPVTTSVSEPPQVALTKECSELGDIVKVEKDGFEGMEDFDEFGMEDQEFGEEYAERRWLEEQRLEEEMHEDLVQEKAEEQTPEKEEASMKQGDVDRVTRCPICDGSMEGTTDAEAAAHVNGCIDGKPTPLPAAKLPPAAKDPRKDQDPLPARTPPAPVPGFRRFQQTAIARPAQENPFTLAAGKASGFSLIMSGNAEDRAWAKAAENEVSSRGKPAYERTCPFYKIMPGFSICVDAFRYGKVEDQEAYFLSHFHSDHYIGLTSSWRHGPIYCSKVTGNLVRQQLRVDPKWVVDLEFEKTAEVPRTQGVMVTMIPANHCPGSSLFLFEKKHSKAPNAKATRILHCGDFRACPAHVSHPLLRPDTIDKITGRLKQQTIDTCYLDTTYLNPKYAFPNQEDVIGACAEMCVSLSKSIRDTSDSWERSQAARAGSSMVQFLSKPEPKPDVPSPKPPLSRGRLLVVIGTYSIGKERICLGIARALNSKIYATPGKQRICAALEDPELSALLTNDPREAQVHMQMLMEMRAETLGEYLQGYKPHFSRIVGFRPTGWQYRPPTSRFTDNPAVSDVLHSDGWKSRFTVKDLSPQRGSTDEAKCFGVPYSEHSSFRELTMFCCALRIGRVVPTVNVGSKVSRGKMMGWVEKWDRERRRAGLYKVQEGQTTW